MTSFFDLLGYLVLGLGAVIILGALISIAGFCLKMLGYLILFLIKIALAVALLAFGWLLYSYLYVW